MLSSYSGLVKNAFQPLREDVESTLLEMEGTPIQQTLRRASSKEALEAKLDHMFEDSRSRLFKQLERTKGQIKDAIPEDDQGRRDWENQVLPQVEGTLKATESFIGKLFDSIIKFFLSLWSVLENAVVWVSEKVTDFVVNYIMGVSFNI